MLDDRTDVEDLLRRVGQTDHGAFVELYGTLFARVFGRVLRVTRNRELAEEVAQDVFLVVWTQAASYEAARGSATSWILTIAHHRAVDSVRHEAAWRRRSASEPSAPGADLADAVAVHDELLGGLATLTSLQRTSIALAYYGGYTSVEVADLVHAGPAAVKTRIRDGLVRMRNALDVPAPV
ncbi:MAG: sigma factor [Nocardioidaceae bacterium]